MNAIVYILTIALQFTIIDVLGHQRTVASFLKKGDILKFLCRIENGIESDVKL